MSSSIRLGFNEPISINVHSPLGVLDRFLLLFDESLRARFGGAPEIW